MRELEAFWPTYERIRDCLKVDAEAADPAVLLAVHQPMRFTRRVYGAGLDPSLSNEEDLLKALLAETGDGRVIVPVVGNSGVGKSHVIRWLDARLQHAPGRDQRIVLRISKGQSLRRILGTLLALPELHGARFDPIRKQLEKASDKVSDVQAANFLCESLAQSLEEASKDAERRIKPNDGNRLLRLQRDLGKSDKLPALLRDQTLRDQHWLARPGLSKGCIARLVEQFTTSIEADGDDSRKHQFEPTDLELDPAIRQNELGTMQRQALGLLQLHRDDRRAEVASVLNSALDAAKQQVLGLGTTISDLFDDVRRELGEGKELVLLVEDFAVLSGMQKQLLEAIIREGFSSGRQVLCTLRTALAYTEGSASFLLDDTYRQRAKVEWFVPEETDVSGDPERVVRLVGAYLNAARIGVEGLQRALHKASLAGDPPDAIRKWLPHAKQPPEGSDTAEDLAAFGDDERGNALFPLNRAAIACLLEDWCRKGEGVVYNPRLILQGILLKTLERRHEFIGGTFPARDFRSERNQGSENVALELGKRVKAQDRERYLTVLAYWYGDARTWGEVEKCSPKIFDAFGLNPPWRSDGTVGPPEPPPPTSPPGLAGSSPASKARSPTVPIDELKKWREGQKLAFERSNKIRKDLTVALEGAIEWDWYFAEPRRKVKDLHESVFVPRASGGMQNMKATDAMALLCTEDELGDTFRGASVVGQIRALANQADGDGKWDYDGAEWEAARYCAVVERSRASAARFVLERPVKTPEDLVPALAAGLAVSARVLGVAGGDSIDHGALVAALFDATPTRALGTAPAGGDAWAAIEREMARWRGATGKAEQNWRTALLRLVGARQGGGAPLAVDVGRLKKVLEDVTKKWTVPPASGLDSFVDAAGGPGIDLKKFDLSKHINDEAVRVSRWADRIESALGPLVESDSLTRACDAVEDAVRTCQSAGLATARVADDLAALTKRVRSLPASALLRNARELAAAESTGTRLALRARHDLAAEVGLANWLDRIDELFGRAEGKLPEVPSEGGADPVALAREALAKSLDALAVEFERVGQP